MLHTGGLAEHSFQGRLLKRSQRAAAAVADVRTSVTSPQQMKLWLRLKMTFHVPGSKNHYAFIRYD